jgi:positive regulator of sigma E activity
MNYLKYTQYVYLVAAFFFAYKAIDNNELDKDQHLLFLGIAVLSICLFFFRRKFAKKFEDRNKQS